MGDDAMGDAVKTSRTGQHTRSVTYRKSKKNVFLLYVPEHYILAKQLIPCGKHQWTPTSNHDDVAATG